MAELGERQGRLFVLSVECPVAALATQSAGFGDEKGCLQCTWVSTGLSKAKYFTRSVRTGYDSSRKTTSRSSIVSRKTPVTYWVHRHPNEDWTNALPTTGPMVGPPTVASAYPTMATPRCWGDQMSLRTPPTLETGAPLKTPWKKRHNRSTYMPLAAPPACVVRQW